MSIDLSLLTYPRRLILADILGLSIDKLFVNYQNINFEQQADFFMKCKLLDSGYPLDYLLSKVSINEVDLTIPEGVFIPRPETEKLIDLINLEKVDLVVDLCSGTGFIGLSLAKKYPEKKFICVDVDDLVIKTIKNNVLINNVKNIEVIQSNIFKNEDLQNFINKAENWALICNPPYVPSSDIINIEKNNLIYEPQLAIFSGEDGLDFFRELLNELKLIKQPEFVWLELDPRNIFTAEKLTKEFCKTPKVVEDNNSLSRFLFFTFYKNQ